MSLSWKAQVGAIENVLDKASLSTGSQRVKVMRSIAKKVRLLSHQRIKNQTNVDGTPFKKRASGKRKKMLVKAKSRLKVVNATSDAALIGFFSPVTSGIFAKHQYGHTQLFNKSQFHKSNVDINTAPATRRQAKALRDVGYKRALKGKGHKTASLKWITENMSISHAGKLIRLLRGTKESWSVILPKRSFLGITDKELSDITQQTIDEVQATLG